MKVEWDLNQEVLPKMDIIFESMNFNVEIK